MAGSLNDYSDIVGSSGRVVSRGVTLSDTCF